MDSNFPVKVGLLTLPFVPLGKLHSIHILDLLQLVNVVLYNQVLFVALQRVPIILEDHNPVWLLNNFNVQRLRLILL